MTEPWEMGLARAGAAAEIGPPLTVALHFAFPDDLLLGVKFRRVSYEWRPWPERPADHFADMIRLYHSLKKAGRMTNPLITWEGHVLIGMRRLEIARMLEWDEVPVADIVEDISNDPTPDRVFALRDRIYAPVSY